MKALSDKSFQIYASEVSANADMPTLDLKPKHSK